MASIVSGLIEQIQTEGNTGTSYAIASTAYGVCDTAATEAIKNVDMIGFVLKQGVTVHIKFTYSNTASNPKLKFNSEADENAKNIMLYGSQVNGSDQNTSGWHAGAILTLTYDGTNWIRNQSYTKEVLDVANGGTGVTSADDIFATYGIEYIVGTQTGSKATAWTGVTKSSALYIGKTIAYKLPIPGNGSATLQLTLDNGNGGTTAAYPVYAGNTRLTTHYPANTIMIMVWNGTDWRTNAYYNTNTLLRTYSSATNIDVPLIGQSSANSTTAAWTTYTNTSKDWYGVIPNDDTKRAKINLSTGHITVPGGITADITGSATSVPLSGVTDATGLQAIEALSGAGLLKRNSDNSWSLDTSTYLTTHNTAYLYAGANNATAHAARTTGNNIYLCLRDGGTQTTAIQIHEGNNMTISSDTNGVITFAATDTTYSNFIRSGSTAAAGLVPAPPTSTDDTHFLCEDGTWKVPGYTTSLALTAITGTDDLRAIEALTGTGFLKRTANNTWSLTTAVTSVTLTSGAGITVSSSGTAITDTGSRTISITGMDTTNGEEDVFLSEKGTWVSISTASYNTLGLVKPYFSISGNATISGTSAANRTGNVTLEDRSSDSERYYAVEVDSNGVLFVNVPWTNVNSAYQGTLSFEGTYNASTNKVATQSTVSDAIEALDVNNITGFGTTKTLKTLSETDGKISATFQAIDFPVISVAGLDGEITDSALISALGLSYAMHYRGTISTDPTTTTPSGTYAAGDVLVHTTTSKEYVYDGSEWRELGDESSYKLKQTAVADPTVADASDTATEFISNISQNENGEISVTKKAIGNSPTATAWASAQTVYVNLASSGTDSTLTGGSSSAQVLKVNGILPIGNGGTGASSFTDGYIVYPSTTNSVQTLTGNSNFKYNSTGHVLTLGKLAITGTSSTNDSSIVNTTGTVTIKSKTNMYVSTTNSGSIIFTTNNTARGRFDTSGHFIPEATNTYTLGLAAGGTESNAKRWKALFLGTQDSYGDEYTPIYWTDSGVPAAATVIQKASFSLTSANSGSQSVTTNTTANSHIVEIVVDTGMQYLLSTITCTPGANTITVSASVDGTVSGYILYIK